MKTNEETSYSFVELLGDLLKRIRPYRARFITASIIRLAGDIINLYPAFALAEAVNFLTNYHKGESLQPIIYLVIFMLLAYVIRNISLYYAKSLAYRVAEMVSIDAQKDTIQHLLKLDMSWQERENTGNKLKRIERGSQGFNRLIRIWINNIIEIAINFIGIIWIFATFDRLVSIMVAIFMLVYYLLSIYLNGITSRAVLKVNIEEEVVNGLVYEVVNNIRSVKVMDMIPKLKTQISTQFNVMFNTIKDRILRFQLRSTILRTVGDLSRIGIIVIIIFGILDKKYEVGFLVLFLGYFNNIWNSVSELSELSQEVVVARIGLARMKHILLEPVTIDIEVGKQLMPRNWQTISFKNVSFAYNNNVVLKNLTFDIHRGQRIGIIGLSGAGKSTLFKLLLKEREEYEGDILIDNVPLKDISRQDYYRHISVVLQETEVFNFTLKENITIVQPEDSKNKKLFDQSIKISHVDEFIPKLPNGVSTLIGEKGVKLSGGEKQRLGIARAIFKQPEILLLDEATSHLDLESEEKIQDSFHKFFQNVTAVVIAHRLTTIKEMDRILVIEDGQVVESGSFTELYAKKGRFHELWEKQRL